MILDSIIKFWMPLDFFILKWDGGATAVAATEAVAAAEAAAAAETAMSAGAFDALVADGLGGYAAEGFVFDPAIEALAADGLGGYAANGFTYEAPSLWDTMLNGASNLVYNPDNGSVLGLSGKQWGQQALFQGGSALLNANAYDQQGKATQDAYDSYNRIAEQNNADAENAFNQALANYDPTYMNGKMADTAADRQQMWQESRPTFDPTANIPGSTPQEVRDALTKSHQDQLAAGDKSFAAMNDLNSLSNMLGINSIDTAAHAQDIATAARLNKNAASALASGISAANMKGRTETQAGNALSSMGNLLLASQLSGKA